MGWALIACITAGLAFATDYLGVVACLLVGLVFLVYDRRWFLPGVLVMGALYAIILAPAFIANPQVFVDDVRFTFSSKVTSSPFLQILNVVLNYGELIRRESWVILGIIGLFLLPQRRAKSLVLFVVGLTLLLILGSFPPVGRGRHYLIHLFPFIALGMAAFFERAVPTVLEVLEVAWSGLTERLPLMAKNAGLDRLCRKGQKIVIGVVMFVVVVSPVIWMVFADMAQSIYGTYFIFTGNDDLSLTAEKDVNQVVDYLRGRVTDDDLILASHQIVWAVPTSRQSDWAITLVYEGKDAGYQPRFPKSRFAYDCSLQESAYVILDPLARGLATQLLPDMKGLVQQVEQWPMVFRAGDLEVYKNPLKQ